MENNHVLKGGEFLLRKSKAQEVFILEDINEEQKMIADMCNDFLEKEV